MHAQTSQRIGKVMSAMRVSLTVAQVADIQTLVNQGFEFDAMPQWIRDSVIETENKIKEYG